MPPLAAPLQGRRAERRVIWMFSGQGSQYYQMARDFYTGDPVFRRSIHDCDDVVYSTLGESLADIIYRPRTDRFAPFDETRWTHPALFAVQYACAEMLLAKGHRPDAILGYSLGECVAWTIAGAIRLDEALNLLMRQADLLEVHSVPPGTMLAVLDAPNALARCGTLPRPVWIATRNAPRHFVLGGGRDDVEAVAAALARLEVLTARLPVKVAFHTPLVEPIGPAFRAVLRGIAPKPPRFTLLSGDRGRQMSRWNADNAWDCLRNAIDFERAVQAVEAHGPATYLDLGPAGTMAALVKQNLDASSLSSTHALVTPFGVSPWQRADGSAR